MTKENNFVAAKVLTICSVVFAIIIVLLRARDVIIGPDGSDSFSEGFLASFIPQAISCLLLVATFCYLAHFFRSIGYKGASICIYLFVVLSIISFAVSMLYLYYAYYNPINGFNNYTSNLIGRVFIFLPYFLLVITYVLGIILATVILTTMSDHTISRLVKPFGIRYLIYSITCLLMFILNLLFFNLIFSRYVAELGAESFEMIMRCIYFIHVTIETIPFVIAYLAIVKMYSNYHKMITSDEQRDVSVN